MSGVDLAAIFAAQDEEVARRERILAYRTDPVLWAQEYLGVQLWRMQREVLYSIRDNHNTAVAAAHSVGKSFIASIAMAWWADVHPIEKVKILSTAPTDAQVTGILWDNLRKWHAHARVRYEEYCRRIENDIPLGEYAACDHPLPGRITGENIWKTDAGVQIGVGRKPPDNLLDSAFQGVHAPYLLAIGDEAAGLPKALIEALGNNATGSNNRVLLIANPTDPTCAMADIWKTENPDWKRMNVSLMDSPTISPEEGFTVGESDGMSGWEYVNAKRREWGEDSAMYIARVLGEWAFESGNNLFSGYDLAMAQNTTVMPDIENPYRVLGVDVARMGQDSTVVYLIERGLVTEEDDTGAHHVKLDENGEEITGWRARRVAAYRETPFVSRLELDGTHTVGQVEMIYSLALAHNVQEVRVDIAGMGGGIVDPLYGMYNQEFTIIEYKAGGATPDNRQWFNNRAYQYSETRRLCFTGVLDLDPDDAEVIDELSGIQYAFSNTHGGLQIESKESMKKRGVKSPDFADALIIGLSVVHDNLLENPYAGLAPGTLLTSDLDAFEAEGMAGFSSYSW